MYRTIQTGAPPDYPYTRFDNNSELCPGLLLTEHRRCVPEIIAYCNDLVYKGKLEPCRRESDEERRRRPAFLPPLGSVDVKGIDEITGGSRKNEIEALEIAKWVKTHTEEIEGRYRGKGIGNVLGVITPFSAQKRQILNVLVKELGEKHGIVVGTVHALQGAERNVIIFSPTYGVSHSGKSFFDDGANMMNVAVSRARDSFLVIGNLDLFREDSDTPSGVFARHLRKRGVPA